MPTLVRAGGIDALGGQPNLLAALVQRQQAVMAHVHQRCLDVLALPVLRVADLGDLALRDPGVDPLGRVAQRLDSGDAALGPERCPGEHQCVTHDGVFVLHGFVHAVPSSRCATRGLWLLI